MPFFKETQCLTNTSCQISNRTPTKENSAKIRALNETILRINKQNEELQLEIKDLREDLNREMEGKKFSGKGLQSCTHYTVMFLYSMNGEDFDVKFSKLTVIVMNIYYL